MARKKRSSEWDYAQLQVCMDILHGKQNSEYGEEFEHYLHKACIQVGMLMAVIRGQELQRAKSGARN